MLPSTRRFLRIAALVPLVLLALLPAGPAAADEDGRVKIHLIWTNDVHGHVAPEGARFMNPNFPRPWAGGASAARYVVWVRERAAAADNEAVILVDAGDTWQGAPVGTLTEGKIMEEYYNALDYDAVIPGNHEFDKGKHVAIRMSANLNKKFLAANVFQKGTGKLVDWVEPYRIVERAGLRIGIIGAGTPGTVDMAFAENIEGLEFGELLPAIEKYRDVLYEQEKVDTVIVVVHEGLPFDAEETWNELLERKKAGEKIREDIRGAMDLAHVLERTPVIVGGHTHRGYDEPWIDPVTHTMVFETYGNGSSLGHAILEYDKATGTLLGYEKPLRDRVLVTLFEDQWWPEEFVQAKLKPYIDEAEAGLSVKIGSSRTQLTRRGAPNSPMGNFVTDAMREELSADWAFTNNGGLRTDLPTGDISFGDVLTVLPFGNALCVVEMDGRMICQILERKTGRSSSGISQSGADVVYDPDAPQGQRILACLIQGEPIQADRIYRVVTSTYLMEGNSGLDFLAQIPPDNVQYSQVLTREAVERYLQRESPIAPRADDRWKPDSGGTREDYLRGWDLP